MPKHQSIIQASFILAAAAMISRGLGFIREIIIAHHFGTGTEYDVYLIAVSFPLALSNTMLYTIPNGFIPAYMRVKNRFGLSSAQKMFMQVFLAVSGICFFATLCLMLFAPAFLRLYSPSLQGANRVLGTAVLQWTACLALFGGLFALMRSIMHAEKQFLLPAVAPLFMNGITILSVLLLSGQKQIFSLVWGVVAGYAAQACIVMISGRKDLKFGMSPGARATKYSVFSGLGFVLLVEIMGQFIGVVDRAFFGKVPIGALSALNFANILCQVPIGVIGIAIGTALFPSIAEAAAKNQLSNIAEITSRWLRHVAVLSLPIILLFLAYSQPLIVLVFQRGAFDLESSGLTNQAFVLLCLGVPAFIGHAVLVRIFYALKINSLLPITALALGIKWILSSLFVARMAHRGLALATTISAWTLLIAMVWMLRARVGSLQVNSFLKTTGKVLLSALCAVGLSRWIFGLLPGPLWLTVTISWVLAAGLFLVLANMLSVSEVQIVLRRLRR